MANDRRSTIGDSELGHHCGARWRGYRGGGDSRRCIAVFLRSGTKLYYEELAMTTQLNLMPVNASGFLNNDGSVNFVDMLDYADDQGAAAVLVCADPSFMDQRTALIKAINDAGVPAAYPFRAYVYGGGLMSVGPDLTTVYSQVGRIAAQILNGSSPPIYNATDLPVWINLGTAGTLRKAGVLSASDATLTSLATASGGGVNPPAP
jgi:hypothetical protein